MVDFSIIVCFYNAKTRLEKTIWHLSKLDIQNFSCELVLVDNNSQDGGMAYAQDIWKELGSPFPLLTVTEKIPGLSFARKAGVQQAQGNIVVFCDDDNWLIPNFIQSVAQDVHQFPTAAVIGAKGLRVEGLVTPNWFEHVQEFFAVGSKQRTPGFVETVYGAGIAVHRNLLLDYYALFKGILTGRTGAQLSSGEDTEICLALQWMGYQIYSNPNNTFQHAIPEDRFTKDYVFGLVKAMAASQLRIEGLRSIVYGVPFPFVKRGIRDFLWILQYSFCLLSPKKRIWYCVWARFRVQFWMEIVRNRANVSHYFQEKYWINTHSAAFTKYSHRSEKPFAGL